MDSVKGLEPLADECVKGVVWFEAWRYQNESAPIVALLHEIRSQLAWHVKLSEKTKKLLAVTIRGALLSLEDLTKKIGFQASKIEEAGRTWEQEHLAAALPSHTIRKQLEEAIYGLIAPGVEKKDRQNQRLVVLIDDLDRCEGDAAYRLLEGLKIYLNLPNCVFVLGMNQQVVEDAIAEHIPKSADCRQRSQAYMEKLCQNIWRLPYVREPKKYLLGLIPDTMTAAKQCIEAALNLNAHEANEPIQPVPNSQVPNARVAAADTSCNCLPPNPRRIKGFANLLLRFAENHLPRIEAPLTDELVKKTRLMLIVAYFYQFHHELYRLWESELEVFRHMLRYVRGEPAELTGAETEQEKQAEDRLSLAMLLKSLRPSVIIRKRADATYDIKTAFPDPADSSVFWIQPLIHTTALQAENVGDALTPESFRPFFRTTKENHA